MTTSSRPAISEEHLTGVLAAARRIDGVRRRAWVARRAQARRSMVWLGEVLITPRVDGAGVLSMAVREGLSAARVDGVLRSRWRVVTSAEIV